MHLFETNRNPVELKFCRLQLKIFEVKNPIFI